jgi:uncharacterized membrane protein
VIAWLRSARGLATLLVVSVAANLFLGGVLAGRLTGQAGQESPTRRSIQAMLAALPEDKRALVREEIRAVLPQVREQFAALQAARAALAGELVKTAPDAAALERGFAEVRSRGAAIQAAFQQAIARAAPSLTQEERRAMVQALARRARPGALPEL